MQLQPRGRARERFGALVRARDDRDAIAPLEPERDLPEQVGPGSAALWVGPVAVGQQQDVPHAVVTVVHPAVYTGPLMPLGPRLRRGLAVGAAALALTPANALAQGAGDDQYSDPFGSDQEEATPTPTPRAPAATATPAPAQSAATPAAAQPAGPAATPAPP